MHVVVTGAGGFVGGPLVQELAARGFAVTAVYRSAPPPVIPGVRFLRADLSVADGLAALPARFDALAHFAATSPGPGVAAARLVRDNLEGLDPLFGRAAAAGASRVVLASSLSLYGRVGVAELDEATPSVDADAYGTTKRLGELMLAERAAALPGLALRLPGIVGPGCRSNFVSGLVRRLIRHQPVGLYNPEGRFNNVVHAAELAAFVAGVLARGWSGFDVLTLGAAGSITIREMLERLVRAVGSRSAVAFEPAGRPAFTISSRRAVERYGYAPSEVGALLERYAREEMAAEPAVAAALPCA
jgi:UDP-glucose 4-epimerase